MMQRFLKIGLVALILKYLPATYSPLLPSEQRVAPLSRQLTTVILDHQHFGSHLNSSRITVDWELERRNFSHAGNRLADLFAGMVLDGHETFAKYVKPSQDKANPRLSARDKYEKVTQQWICNHTSSSNYCLQFVCCDDESCCRSRPSHVKLLLRPLMPYGFLPPSVKRTHKCQGNSIPLI